LFYIRKRGFIDIQFLFANNLAQLKT